MMQSGYCFELNRSKGERQRGAPWFDTCNESWDIVVYTPTGTENKVGTRHIDGSDCTVYLCSDGKYRAQTRVSTGE